MITSFVRLLSFIRICLKGPRTYYEAYFLPRRAIALHLQETSFQVESVTVVVQRAR